MMASLASAADRVTRAAAVLLLLSLLACVFLGVVFRQFNNPLAWSDEMAQYLLVWTGLIGWIIATRRRSHIRITVFADKLPGVARRALEIAIQLGILVFGAILARYSFGLIERTWDVESVSLPLTTAVLYMPVPVAGLALILQAIVEIGEALRGDIQGAPEPGAQPL